MSNTTAQIARRKSVVGVRLPDDLRSKVEEIAEHHGISVSDVVRIGLRRAVTSWETDFFKRSSKEELESAAAAVIEGGVQ